MAAHFKKSPDTLEADTRLGEDLGADSLDLLDLRFQIEHDLRIQIPDARATRLETIGDVVRCLETPHG